MNSIDASHADNLARSLFDDAVAPLAEARRAVGSAPYFPHQADAGAASYFERPPATRMTAADFEFPGGGDADGLIEALAARWAKEGEAALAAMAPRLKEIAEALRQEGGDNDGSVDILCYTMF